MTTGFGFRLLGAVLSLSPGTLVVVRRRVLDQVLTSIGGTSLILATHPRRSLVYRWSVVEPGKRVITVNHGRSAATFSWAHASYLTPASPTAIDKPTPIPALLSTPHPVRRRSKPNEDSGKRSGMVDGRGGQIDFELPDSPHRTCIRILLPCRMS